MHPPRLPGDPHLVTLLYLLGLVGLIAAVVWICQTLRAQQQEG